VVQSQRPSNARPPNVQSGKRDAAMLTSTPDHLVQLTRYHCRYLRRGANRPEPAQAFALHYRQAHTPLVQAVPDAVYPGMWRLLWPDGQLSDLANLSRIRDAAIAICERGPPQRDRFRLHWKINPSNSLSGGRTRARQRRGGPKMGISPSRDFGRRGPSPANPGSRTSRSASR